MLPKWVTPERVNYMDSLFAKSGGFCVHGHPNCQTPDHHYLNFLEGLIDDWKAQNRDRRSVEWKLEQRTIHDGTYGRWGSSFDPVARDVFLNQRPEYYLVGLGVGALTKQAVALVRIPSMDIHLFVDVSKATRKVSRNARRKAQRYGRALPNQQDVDTLCAAAVRDWWVRPS